MLKKIFLSALIYACFVSFLNSQVVHFEDLTLPPDSFWNGSDSSGGFTSGIAFFNNNFVDYGGGFTAWDGFSYSNKLNDSLQSFSDLYSCFPGIQLSGSEIFAISYNPMDFINYNVLPNFIQFTQPVLPQSLFVTNSTYTGLTIKNGDMFSKKFGGDTGNDPDWFKLEIFGMNDTIITGSVEFYLADYRYSDNFLDYIIKDWVEIDISSLNTVTSIGFLTSSSDTGSYGMNTPAFFCFDNLSFLPVAVSVNNLQGEIRVYPNPFTDRIYCDRPAQKIKITNINGLEVIEKTGNLNSVDVQHLPAGIYIAEASLRGKTYFRKLIKL